MTALLCALALAVATPSAADASAAQQVMSELRALFPGGVFRAAQGDYVIYRVGAGPYRYWRVAIVGKERVGGADAMWVETTFGPNPDGHGLLGLKLLTTGDPRHPGDVRKAYFRIGAGKTLAMDPDMLEPSSAPQAPVATEEAQLPPGATIPTSETTYELKQVPAGSFRSMRAETSLGLTLWVSPDVPVFHLVAARLPVGGELELVQMGHDAKDTVGQPTGRISRGQLKEMVQSSDGGRAP